MKLDLRRFRFLGLLVLAFLIFIPTLVFGIDTPDSGYSIPANTTYKIISPTGHSTTCVKNTSGISYFIPTKTAGEFNSFEAHLPTGVSICDPCTGNTCGTAHYEESWRCVSEQPQCLYHDIGCSAGSCYDNGTAYQNVGPGCNFYDWLSDIYQCSGNQPQRRYDDFYCVWGGCNSTQTWQNYGSACPTAGTCQTGGGCSAGSCVAVSNVSPCCGNLSCESGETCASCPGDCGACPNVPRIAYWSGKVNQHIAGGVWTNDPDCTSGASIDMLTYCRKWYPNTLSYTAYLVETITTWRDAGCGGPYTAAKQSYECVQPVCGDYTCDLGENCTNCSSDCTCVCSDYYYQYACESAYCYWHSYGYVCGNYPCNYYYDYECSSVGCIWDSYNYYCVNSCSEIYDQYACQNAGCYWDYSYYNCY